MKHIALFPICTSVMKNLLVKFTSTSSASRATSRVVLISTSDNIYENLAFEEWMYEKTDFSDTDYLYLWRNQPAVVCGRHQNPWLEANIPQACADGVHIARRWVGNAWYVFLILLNCCIAGAFAYNAAGCKAVYVLLCRI